MVVHGLSGKLKVTKRYRSYRVAHTDLSECPLSALCHTGEGSQACQAIVSMVQTSTLAGGVSPVHFTALFKRRPAACPCVAAGKAEHGALFGALLHHKRSLEVFSHGGKLLCSG